MLAMMAGAGVVVARTELPEFDSLAQASYICASDVQAGQCSPDNAMTRLQADDGNRITVQLDEVPEVVVQAVLATEDRDFYEHDGVNPIGIARAMFQNVRAGSIEQGGSTITQQYVLNAFKLSRDGGISRKLKEAVLSVKLEQEMSKDDILEGYLNTIFFGRGAYGIGAASRAYFGIDVRQITDPGQAALLAGLIRSPALAEPMKHPEEATRRRTVSLEAMQDEGYLTEEQVAAAEAIPVAEPWVIPAPDIRHEDTLRGGRNDPNGYMGTDYLPAYIKSEVQALNPDLFTEELIDTGGLRIYTSIDYARQKAAWDAVTGVLNQEDDAATPEWEGDPEASLVSVDDQGLVRAMVASRHPYDPKHFNNNYAVRGHGSSGRQPGSTFKPIVLAEALREGYSLRSLYNAQGTMEFDEWRDGQTGNPWKVSNYSESDAGVMDLLEATRQSSNTAFAQLMLDLGIDPVDGEGEGDGTVAEGSFNVAQLAQSMGVMGGDIPDDQTVPPMVLGTVNATPLEMAGAYSTFANRGVFRQPDLVTRVEQVNEEGQVTVLYERRLQEQRVLSEGQADLVNHALQGVLESGGTGEGANIGKPAAGKTGTSQQNKNAWFAGYVPKLTTVVWMGHPNADFDHDGDPETPPTEWPMNEDGILVHGRSATGGSFPAEIWRNYMQVATEGLNDDFVEVTPEQINSGEVLNEDELGRRDEQPGFPGPGGPDISIPGFPGGGGDGNGNGGGNGGGGGGNGGGDENTATTIAPPDTTTTTGPPSSDTTTTSSIPPISLARQE
jgi:membrane peptidoglycan carboxypeptidase